MVVNKAESSNNCQAAKKFGVTECNVRRWREPKQRLKDANSPTVFLKVVVSVSRSNCVAERSKCVAQLQLNYKAALLFKVWLHVFKV